MADKGKEMCSSYQLDSRMERIDRLSNIPSELVASSRQDCFLKNMSLRLT